MNDQKSGNTPEPRRRGGAFLLRHPVKETILAIDVLVHEDAEVLLEEDQGPGDKVHHLGHEDVNGPLALVDVLFCVDIADMVEREGRERGERGEREEREERGERREIRERDKGERGRERGERGERGEGERRGVREEKREK